MKTKQDNDVVDCSGAIYTKNDTELLCSIGLKIDYDENQVGQRHDQTYKCSLRQK